MGYDVNRFDGEIKSDLICTICSEVFEDPVQRQQCEHFYCRKCIMPWIERNATCPIDRGALQESDLKEAPRLLKSLLADLNVKCDFASNGCRIYIKLEQLSNHSRHCDFNPETFIGCFRDGCEEVFPRRSASSHTCSNPLVDVVQKLRTLIKEKDEFINKLIAEIKMHRNEKDTSDVGSIATIAVPTYSGDESLQPNKRVKLNDFIGSRASLYTCDKCQRRELETRYHCTECEDFDLCVVCYNTEGHLHRMEKLGVADLVGAVDAAVAGANGGVIAGGSGSNTPSNQPTLRVLPTLQQPISGKQQQHLLQQRQHQRILQLQQQRPGQQQYPFIQQQQQIVLQPQQQQRQWYPTQQQPPGFMTMAQIANPLVQPRYALSQQQQQQPTHQQLSSASSFIPQNLENQQQPRPQQQLIQPSQLQPTSQPGSSAVTATVTGGAPQQSQAMPAILQQLLETLRSPSSPQQQQQVLQVLKSNPQLMAQFIKQRTQQQAQQQQQLPHVGQGHFP